MSKKLKDPMNPRISPFLLVLAGLVFFLYDLMPHNPFLTEMRLLQITLMSVGLWGIFRLYIVKLGNTEIEVSKFILFVASFTVIFTLLSPFFTANMFDDIPIKWKFILTVIGGMWLGVFSEVGAFHFNKLHMLQTRAIEKLAHDQALTIEEIAAMVPSGTVQNVERALGRKSDVPASVARKWLENVKGIRCPPTEKKQLNKKKGGNGDTD
ncbi:MAG: hypothetical protein ACOYUZ_05380 [Patescibacteria group bacterium]